MASIKKLDPIVASRIAAGEVVERPASVLRELLDNSIDANSSKISVYLEQGGIKAITVIDDGDGMSAQDLVLACQSHATSKVYTLDDLFNLKTMGFRGEALSSIAACSKVTINSNGNRIIVDNGVQSQVLPGSISQGTSICMENLFENIPARKLFLKRPQSEASECKKTFIEKALGFENIEFLLFSEGELKLHFKPCTKEQRTVEVMALDKAFTAAQVINMSYEGENLKMLAVGSDASCYKRDRSQIKIFINNRIVDCYPFVQAITNAWSAALPGGAFPFFYLYIEDEPSLVDFNIHPTKRECKLRNQSQIYGCITNMIRQALINKTYKIQEKAQPQEEKLFTEEDITPITYSKPVAQKPTYSTVKESSPFDPSWFESAKSIMAKSADKPTKVQQENISKDYKYIGQAFNTFLLVETEQELLFIDQHALHERILYDEIKALKDVQKLIVPYSFEVELSVDEYLQKNSQIYADFGIQLERKESLLWEMTSLPAACRKNENQVISYIQTMTGDIESAQKGLFAIIACHAAIKAGDELDAVTAKALVNKAFELDRMVCPHGRSFTWSIKKETLYKEVGRIV